MRPGVALALQPYCWGLKKAAVAPASPSRLGVQVQMGRAGRSARPDSDQGARPTEDTPGQCTQLVLGP
jgi:hypothetical protein